MYFRISIWFAVAMTSASAIAAQLAQIDPLEVEVYAEPDAKSRVVDKLKKGQYVAASNHSVKGFYKIRTPRKEIGWITADALILRPETSEQAGETSASDENFSD